MMQQFKVTLPIGAIIEDSYQNRYIVEALLGAGGFSAVYLVREQGIEGTLYAIKEAMNPSKHDRSRIIFEGEVLKKLKHKALPRVYGVFDDDEHNRTYLIMDYIKGADLESLRLQQPEERIPLFRTLTIMAPIIDAVIYLHRQYLPIIHRDITPANIIIPTTSNEAVLVDFGLAKEYVPGRITTGIRHGTPCYAAPEQYRGGTSPRTDVYGLGATIYTLMTGTFPADALYRLTEEEGIDPLVPMNQIVQSIPMAVADDICRAMSISSHDRFSTVEEFWQTLHAHAMYPPVPVPVIANVENDVPAASQTQLSASPSRKRAILFSIVFASLVIIGIVMGLWLYTGKHPGSTSTGHGISSPPTSVPKSTSVPTLTPGSIGYPPIAEQYVGTIDDLLTNVKTNISLSSIQQGQGNIRGNFTGLGLNGPFTGTVDPSGSIQFQVPIYSGNAILSFEGKIKLGGDIAGSYQVLNQNRQFTGENGLWTVSPPRESGGSVHISP